MLYPSLGICYEIKKILITRVFDIMDGERYITTGLLFKHNKRYIIRAFPLVLQRLINKISLVA